MAGRAEYKIILLGAKGVGKTTYGVRFTSGHFVEEDVEFMYERYGFRKQLSTENGGSCVVDIWDFLDGRPSPMQVANTWRAGDTGYFIMYSVTSEEAFVALEKYITEIQAIQKDVPFVIVGTKTDLAARCIPHTLGEELAKKYNVPFYEINNITGANVKESMVELCRKIEEFKVNMANSSNRKPRERCIMS